MPKSLFSLVLGGLGVMGNFWFMDPFVLEGCFLLLTPLYEEEDVKDWGRAHLAVGTSQKDLPHWLCSAGVLIWGAIRIGGHLVVLALAIAHTSVSMTFFRATTVSEDIFELWGHTSPQDFPGVWAQDDLTPFLQGVCCPQPLIEEGVLDWDLGLWPFFLCCWLCSAYIS